MGRDKNSFAPLPPMGWNSYDYYDTTVSEERVRANADYMAGNLRDYGWRYIVVDIQWYAHGAGSRRDEFQYIPFSKLEMDEYGRLLPDTERFPSAVDGAGFRPLADYIHSLGLKFGIHIMRGIPRKAAHDHMPVKGAAITADEIADPSSICGWNPDMYGVRDCVDGQAYYDSLLELYAGWGVDFIKCDDICNTNLYAGNPYSARHEVEMLARAIQNCGREIVLSLSPGPALLEQAWHYETYANMWRITDDFWDDWRLLKEMFHRCELWQDHVKKGCYPDCDMLPLGFVGRGFGRERQTNFTREEQRTMMSLWCLFGSPLMIGAELTKLDPWTQSLLTNRDILEMLSPECRPAQLCRDDSAAAWMAYHEQKGLVYVALFYLGEEPGKVGVRAEDIRHRANALSLSGGDGDFCLSEQTEWTELWSGGKTFFEGGNPETELPAHGCAVYRARVER